MARKSDGNGSSAAPARSSRSAKPAKDRTPLGLPTAEQVLEFVRVSPGKVGKREIAQAFGIRGSDKIALKSLLADMAEQGHLTSPRKRIRGTGDLPKVAVLDVVGLDGDGELIGEPADWEQSEGITPRVHIVLDKRGAAPGVGERVLCEIGPPEPGDTAFSHTGRVVRVLEREKKRLLGIFSADARGGGTIRPIDKKQLRDTRVEAGNDGGAENGELVRFDIARLGRNQLPGARIVERLGNPASAKQISLIAVHAHGIPDVFPKRVLDEVAELPPLSRDGREDLTGMPLVTIDPVDARDHDDAVWATPDPDPKNAGGFVVLVAIADVAGYVRSGTALDREAERRGNSVYFPDRVVPMLPERISNDLCSLREGELRPCLAVRMFFGANGEKRSHAFTRGLMRSAAKLSYQQAQAAIDGNPDDKTGPLLEPILKPLWAAYAALCKARDARGPLDLDLPERRIEMAPDGTIARITVPERLAAHRLIEEFMIQANVAAAETLEAKRTPLLFRVHDQPSKEKLHALKGFLATLDVGLPGQAVLRPEHFNTVLAKTRGTEVSELVSEVVLRSQSQAEYNPANIGHFGLNLKKYAHFTSPIRRYADLVVHRALIRALRLGDDGLTEDAMARLTEVARAISDTERRAMSAERETSDRLMAAHLAERIGARFVARISGVTKSGLFVRLKETGADGFIPISTLGAEYFTYDEHARCLIGERSRQTFRLGDTVEVELVEAVPTAGALRFEMVSRGNTTARPPGVEAKLGKRGQRRQLGRHTGKRR
jgi:ribonuclease R